jgi:hypothetical protein
MAFAGMTVPSAANNAAVRYALPDPQVTSGGGLLGSGIRPLSRNALLVMAIVLGALIGLGVLFADGVGLGPRHREWRARWALRLQRPHRP